MPHKQLPYLPSSNTIIPPSISKFPSHHIPPQPLSTSTSTHLTRAPPPPLMLHLHNRNPNGE